MNERRMVGPLGVDFRAEYEGPISIELNREASRRLWQADRGAFF
jgi:hypothetical protein